MRDVVIVAACRTAIGTIGGQFRSMTAAELSVPVMHSLLQRPGCNGALVEDVIWGCNYQRTYLENNVARVAAMKAGLPNSVPGITVHRNCTSSMSAIQMGYYQIKSGEANCIMAGGVDSMSNAPHMVFNVRYGKKFGHTELRDSMWDSLTNLGIGPPMGITAENVAEQYQISRQEQDAYALLSQQRASDAIAQGKFKDEIIPVIVNDGKTCTVCELDEYPKKGVALEKLAALRPAFKENGTVTAGNSSGMNDAASGMLLVEQEIAAELGLPVLAKIVSTATTGVPAEVMGIAPISATQKALEKAKLTIADIGLFEINEAFAAQCIACEKELGVNRELMNVNGGGISLGHPVGATGCRIVVSLIYEMRRRKVKYAVATLCAGGGMGTAIVLENPQVK